MTENCRLHESLLISSNVVGIVFTKSTLYEPPAQSSVHGKCQLRVRTLDTILTLEFGDVLLFVFLSGLAQLSRNFSPSLTLLYTGRAQKTRNIFISV